MSAVIPAPEGLVPPTRFTQETLDWVPWVEPLPIEEVTEHHYEALVQRSRVKNPYFRLLARDPDILRERTKADLDIFLNTDAGLPRAKRELAATAASRVNGCVRNSSSSKLPLVVSLKWNRWSVPDSISRQWRMAVRITSGCKSGSPPKKMTPRL